MLAGGGEDFLGVALNRLQVRVVLQTTLQALKQARLQALLVGVAFVLATPAAYLAMNHWLQDFAYRIEISWGIFLMAGLAALGVALLTVSYQAVRAALSDPVKALRSE